MEYKNEAFFLNGKEYIVHIEKKATKTLSMRLDKDLVTLKVFAPYFISKKEIMAFVNKKAPALIERVLSQNERLLLSSRILFGVELDHPLDEKNLKKALLDYVSSRQIEFESLMKTPHYLSKVRKMTSRYGVNNLKSKTITYALTLAHYDKKIIDAIIVHELAHHYQRNHQKGFYDIVYRYSPNYKELIKKLKGGIFK